MPNQTTPRDLARPASRRPARVSWQEFAAAARTRGFWATVARHSLPLAGVAFFSWSALNVAVFFLLESWLFLTTRGTIEVTFDPKHGQGALPRTAWEAVSKTAVMFLIMGVFFALIVFGFGGFVVGALPPEEWSAFTGSGWRRPTFLLSLLLLAIDAVNDAIAFHRRLFERSHRERKADDQRLRLMLHRVVALMAGAMVIVLGRAVGLGGPALVLVITVILVYVDAFPHRALRLLD